LFLGGGVGLGMGYANCQHDFQTPYIRHGNLVQAESKVSKQISNMMATSIHTIINV